MSDSTRTKDILDVPQQPEYAALLGPDDPRCVDAREPRGIQRTLGRVTRQLGLMLLDGAFSVQGIITCSSSAHTRCRRPSRVRSAMCAMQSTDPRLFLRV